MEKQRKYSLYRGIVNNWVFNSVYLGNPAFLDLINYCNKIWALISILAVIKDYECVLWCCEKYASVVELIIFTWTAEVQIYWQSPLFFCGLFDFFALWLARDVSPAAGELRFDDLWWHVAWRVSGNICLWLFMLNISVSLLLVMFKHKGQYFKTNTSVTSSMLSRKHTYQLTSTTSVTFALACRFIPGFS